VCVLFAFTLVDASKLRNRVPVAEAVSEESASLIEESRHHRHHRNNGEEVESEYYWTEVHPKGWRDPNAPIPANMSIPDIRLNKPIIYEPKLHRNHPDRDLPLIGKLEKKHLKLKKINITTNLYGGVVEWKRGITKFGCPCKHRKKNKFRYDAEYKPRKNKHKKRCRCHRKHRKPKLPPVLPAYYPKRHSKKHKKVCVKRRRHRKHKVAPEYYPKRKHHKKFSIKKHIKKCLRKFRPKKISPEYYPSKKLNRKQRHAEWLRERGINPATPNAAPSTPAA